MDFKLFAPQPLSIGDAPTFASLHIKPSASNVRVGELSVASVYGAISMASTMTTSSYALMSDGVTFTAVNAPSGGTIALRIGNADKVSLSAAGDIGIGTNNTDGNFHVMDASAGDVTAYVYSNLGIFEDSSNNGISILTPENSYRYLTFGGPASNTGAQIISGGSTVSATELRHGISLYTAGIRAFTVNSSQNVVHIDTVLGKSTWQSGRYFIQNNTSGSRSVLEIFTKDGNGSTSCGFTSYAKGSYASTTNSEYLSMGYNFSGAIMEVSSAALGTGTLRPLRIYTGSNTKQLYLDTSNNVGINSSSFGTSANGVLGLSNGTAPTTSPADMIQLYSVDLSAGNATLGLRTETAVTTAAAGASDKYLNIIINGTTYKLLLHS